MVRVYYWYRHHIWINHIRKNTVRARIFKIKKQTCDFILAEYLHFYVLIILINYRSHLITTNIRLKVTQVFKSFILVNILFFSKLTEEIFRRLNLSQIYLLFYSLIVIVFSTLFLFCFGEINFFIRDFIVPK